MNSCQKVHHQNSKIIGICQQCKQTYLGCKFCFAEVHYMHIDDFLLNDNILLIIESVLEKMEMAKQYLEQKNLQINEQFNSFIQAKYTQLQKIKSHLLNQNLQNLLNLEFLITINQDYILYDILAYLKLSSELFSQQQIENIRQVFVNQFQNVQQEYQIILMFDKSCLLYSIQKYEKALQISSKILKLTQKIYFLNKNILEFNKEIKLKSNSYKWSLECLFGRNLYLIKEYKKSLDFFQKLRNNNTNQQILKESSLYISLNLMQLNKNEDAINYLSMYSKIDSTNLLINLFEAFALERFGKLEFALQKYKLMAQKTNKSFYNLLYGNQFKIKLTGKVLLNCKKFHQAQEIFDKVIEHRNLKEIAQVYKCLTLLNQNELESAMKQSETLIDTNQNSVYGCLLKGIILQMQDKIEDVNAMSKYINQQFPDNGWNYFFQSYVLILDSKFEQAQIFLEKISGEKHKLLFFKVLFLLKLNKIQEAFEIIQQLNKEDQYIALLKEAFLIIKENGQAKIGILQFKRLFEINPQDYMAMHYQGILSHRYVGYCFYLELSYSQAIECFNEAIKLKPDLAESYFYKGESLFRELEFSKALDCYIIASKNEEFNNEQVNFQKGNLNLFLSQFEFALSSYEDSKSIDLASIMKAVIDWYQKKFQEASVEAERKKDRYKQLFFMLGMLYNELGNKQFAQYYQDQFKTMNQLGTYNFHKGNYQNGKVFIKYMERNSQSFEKLSDREYEILKYAAWFLDQQAKEISLCKAQWKCPKFFYQSINIEQNRNINEELLKHFAKYPVI
ncbi:unnamed protein product (macronuclear) [Paramecium tetraurelia]|uniref:Uncharacterized protein n=1 Tax=Paramecium tetraurelia TaxID=5888 RepID=A0CBP9_PARTE|nr:uncharacterized protein GSPATT00036999001 [Paramecium tetraurelia]CAK68216.1 unnamed protein product [Paramecium tetraurelia]|eukprot:XP_001435613.1 hypothetical protein (macronuclear) [Paramecium tetraurelia strain d4-2]